MIALESVKQNGDFIDVLVHTSKIKITQVKYFQSTEYGTTYFISFKIINIPEIEQYTFVCKINTNYSKEYKTKWDKIPVNTIGLLADFIEMDHKMFKDMIKCKNTIGIEQAIIKTNRIMKISAKLIRHINASTMQDVNTMKVFNIATESHVTVTFTEIRNILMEFFKLPVLKEIPKNKGTSMYILEQSLQGELVWDIYQDQFQIEDETFNTKIMIYSGKNTKQDAIEVIGLIKITSCDNSLRPVMNFRILRIGDWKQRVIEYLQKIQEILSHAFLIVKNAMMNQISIEQCSQYIQSMNFGLKDLNKIQFLQKTIQDRLMFEYTTHPTLWGLSQAFTNIGSHPTINNMDITNETYDRLQEIGYKILTYHI